MRVIPLSSLPVMSQLNSISSVNLSRVIPPVSLDGRDLNHDTRRVTQGYPQEILRWDDRAGGYCLGERWAWSLVIVRELPRRSDGHGRLREMLIIH